MKKLWQELDNFRPLPESNCLANCNALTKMKEYKDSDQVIRFLKGLNEQYHAVRSQIMLMDPLPPIGRVYSLLVQQERQNVIPLDDSKLIAAVGNSYMGNSYAGRGQLSGGRGRNHGRGGRSNGRGRGNKLCSFCGQTNHVVDTCWKKHGYPPHLQHLQDSGKVNNVTNIEDESQSIGYVEEQVDSDSSKLSFTPEQHKALLALLQGSSSLHPHSLNHITSTSDGAGILCTVPNLANSDHFILDTGATDHVCFSIKFFQCLKRVKPIHIKLPNGTIVSTCYAGTIIFDKNLYLTDVLYFPEFSFNLISVPRLTCSLKCQLIFDNDKCLIQDSYSQKMIGAASLDNGLYLLTQPSITLGPTSLNFCTQTCLSLANNRHKNVDCNTWHMRFGHASYAKLVELNLVR
jgi:hypothetical protein